MVKLYTLEKNGTRSFGLESEIIPYAKLWESYTKLDEIRDFLHSSPHKELLKCVEDIQEGFNWLFDSREFFLFVLGGERYDVGCYDEELEILSTLMYRFVDYLKCFNTFFSYGKKVKDVHVEVDSIKGLYDTLSAYNRTMKSKWESHLSSVKKKKSK